MHRLILSLAAGALALGAATAASAQTSAPARQCFASTSIRGTQPVGDTQVNIRVGIRDVWRLDLSTPCPGLRQASRILDLSPTASASAICGPADLRLGVNIGGSRSECFIDKLTKLTPTEVAALAPRDRP